MAGQLAMADQEASVVHGQLVDQQRVVSEGHIVLAYCHHVIGMDVGGGCTIRTTPWLPSHREHAVAFNSCSTDSCEVSIIGTAHRLSDTLQGTHQYGHHRENQASGTGPWE